jgi:YidC/Oxa1 family membrane protein insertase
MEKRTILAFVLMAAVLVVSQFLLTPPAPEDGQAPGTPADGEPVDARRAPPQDGAGAAADAGGQPGGGAPAQALPPPAAAEPRGARLFAAPRGGIVYVETPLYVLHLATRGAVVTDVWLRRFESFVDSMPVQLVPAGAAFLQKTVRSDAGAVDLSGVDFTAERDTVRVSSTPDSVVLTADAGGSTIRQVLRIDPAKYEIGYSFEAPGLTQGGPVLETLLGPRLLSHEANPKEDLGSFRAVARAEGEVHTLELDDVDEAPARISGPLDWAGIKSKYFLAALLVADRPFGAAAVTVAAGDTLPGFAVRTAMPLQDGRAAYRVFLGPQEFRALTAAGYDLEDVNQYGWSWIRWAIQPFAHVIIRVLLWLHRFLPNYGFVLILFGILVRLLLWPLTQKSFESMQKMQAVQPELQKLRERYKNDPQRMQTEMMKLYRERGVNPLGGCLPNLLPLPVLFALFFVFQNTIEFRGAPFVLWIQDLSRPDPWYVLPVLMGVTMFVQQRLTTPQDNPQMKMMTYFMPAFLTFIFLNLASGLVLYYTVSNVLTFVQQILMKRRSQAAAPVPASS